MNPRRLNNAIVCIALALSCLTPQRYFEVYSLFSPVCQTDKRVPSQCRYTFSLALIFVCVCLSKTVGMITLL